MLSLCLRCFIWVSPGPWGGGTKKTTSGLAPYGMSWIFDDEWSLSIGQTSSNEESHRSLLAVDSWQSLGHPLVSSASSSAFGMAKPLLYADLFQVKFPVTSYPKKGDEHGTDDKDS